MYWIFPNSERAKFTLKTNRNTFIHTSIYSFHITNSNVPKAMEIRELPSEFIYLTHVFYSALNYVLHYITVPFNYALKLTDLIKRL